MYSDFHFIDLNKNLFQSTAQRPTTIKPPENVEVQKTLEENIRDLLQKRRDQLSKDFFFH